MPDEDYSYVAGAAQLAIILDPGAPVPPSLAPQAIDNSYTRLPSGQCAKNVTLVDSAGEPVEIATDAEIAGAIAEHLEDAPHLALGTTEGTAAEGTAPAAAVAAHVQAVTHLALGTTAGTALEGTHAGDPAAHPGLFASKLENKTADFTAVAFGRYQSAGTVIVTDPVSATLNDSYMVRVASGVATIGGVAYSPSRFDVIRHYNGVSWATQTAVITGGITVDGLNRSLIATYTVPQAAALTDVTYDSASKTFACTAHGMANGQVVKLLAGTGVLPAGFTAWTSDLTGVPYFVVGKTSDTFQLSASFGGAAVTTSDSGTPGWTATPMGTSSVTVTGLNVAEGQRIRISLFAPKGIGYVNQGCTAGVVINSDAATKYRQGTAETTYFGGANNGGNVYGFFEIRGTVRGGCFFAYQSAAGNYGTARDSGSGTPVNVSQSCAYDSEADTLTITTVTVSNITPSGMPLKPGTVITIEREA